MADRPFDPSRHLTHLNGRDYLEVKWRLLWLRTEHPEAIVQTELARQEGTMALFKARVAIPGGGEATGWGMETKEDFGDYVEKAETKALGRALAALGYGTQFCEEFESGGSVVDAPVARPVERPAAKPEPPATAAQVKAIYTIARTTLNLGEGQAKERSKGLFGKPPEELSKSEASRLIDRLRDEARAVAS